MDFEPSDEARDLAALTRELANSGRPLWPALAEAGVLAAALPKRADGDGLGLLEQCAILVELGRAAAAPEYLSSIVVAASTLARFGTDEQVAEWAAPAGRGEIRLAASARGEIDVRPYGQEWLLNGEVTAVPGAAEDTPILLAAGADVFVVGPGVTVEAQRVEGGPGAGLVRLDDTPAQRLENAAAWLTARATIGACAAQLGTLERALEMTAEYARDRVQFGRPIGSFQAVSQRIADAYIDVEALRVALWQAACTTEPADVATAGFWAAEAGHRVLHTAVHVHGGVGLDVDYPLHRYFLAAKYHEFLLGGATAQLLTLADSLSRKADSLTQKAGPQ